jgi:hypothetical protein
MKNILIVIVIILNLVTLYTVTNHSHEVIVKERVVVKEIVKAKPTTEPMSLESAKAVLSLDGYEDFKIIDELPCDNSLTIVKPIKEGGYLVLIASK